MKSTNTLTQLRKIIRNINKNLKSGNTIYLKSYPFNIKVNKVKLGPNIHNIISFDNDNMTHVGDNFIDSSGNSISY